ncbi:Electron transfer DM13 [Vibrio crassostreae]|uniref:DM13 domain-containing protein n=1 Tax=Vibrio crassostreae TaxID=246167 RepID=UPI001B30509E|nr:DM13 domain-containing protein [Vibrio crassostreae]CAK2780076.1 Electron transfer DM13 [Vibrio crassostreae]CAK3280715.1 Electron transfer DM13 [Vibrio crassostreae]CAK3293257.1 Electron transfer DM13 [Vibrio crassostreae]CAK3316536.1 Electron transfer DM13 [Vibrio crassostreae]CAK3408787.1 Electron transfer DM13 [Vibrio crassostreae]
MKKLVLLCTHLAVGAVGFGLGVYALPILIEPDSPSSSSVEAISQQAIYTGEFSKDRQDSDFLHWGEGIVSVSESAIAFEGELAPGPDYKVYLSPKFIETEQAFNDSKSELLRVGDVKTFDRFMVALPEGTDLNRFNTVVIWCETFGQFITSAKIK